MIRKKELRKYYNLIRKNLFCSYNMKKVLISDFSNRVNDFIFKNPNVDIQKIMDNFGSPEDIAKSFDTENIYLKKKAKKLLIIEIILIVLMIVDLIVGFLISAIWQKSTKTDSGKLSSSVMFKGIVKKFLTLVIVVIAFQLDKLLAMTVIRHIVIIAFIVEEILSITENIAITGIKIPTIITRALDVLEKEVKSGFSNCDK